MDHIRSLDIMLDKDSDKIKGSSKTNVSLTTKLDKLNESHEELAKKYALLVESNNELLARHNKLIIEHEELTSSYKELENSKFDHLPSNTPSLNDEKPSVDKVDASTSCNDLLDMACSSPCIDIIVTACSPLCNELSTVKTNLARKNHDGKVIAYKIGVEDKHWNQPIWMPRDIIINIKGPKKVWVPKKP